MWLFGVIAQRRVATEVGADDKRIIPETTT
jgi:hypothetical protein